MPFLNRQFPLWVIIPFIIFYTGLVCAQQTQPNKEPHILKVWDTDFQQITLKAFNQLAQKIDSQPITNIKALTTQLNTRSASTTSHKNIVLIYKHIDLILNAIFDPEVIQIHQQLLQHNQLILAAKIQKKATENTNVELLDNIHFQLAVYYAAHQQWRKTINFVTKIEESQSLSKKNQAYAKLIFGIALQHIRKHREALKAYAKIDKTSHYYKHAQLNSAIAFIRQGWWTDAHIAINNAQSVASPDKHNAFINRLHVTLGYSQLQNEFYRDARNTFRKVTLNSEYENRALLGIGLAALSQEDYAGALNAFGRVKARSLLSLSGLEAYLLVAYTQLQSGDHIKAKQNYNQALLYFEHAILTLEQNNQAVVNDNDYTENNLDNGISPIHSLLYLTKAPLSTALKKQVEQLINTLNEAQRNQQQNNAKQTIAYIKSYISQCEYGLASLYDEAQ